MSINRVSALRLVIFLLAMANTRLAIAQSTQLVEDTNVGVRLSIPKNWEWKSRGSDIFINCAPGKGEPGRPGCFFTVRKITAPPDQRAITDADRAKWKAWTNANGMRPIISTRDFTVAGFPAHEIVSKSGNKPAAVRQRRVMVLIPGTGRVLDAWFIATWGDKDYYDQYNPAFAAALETLVPAK
jgi:hypothetical protein